MGPMIVVAMMVFGVPQGQDERLKGWLAKLTDPADTRRLDASDALINFAAQPTDELISALAACLKDSHHLVRANCAIALSRSGSKAAAALPALSAALTDSSYVVRGSALNALGNMGSAAGSELPEIAKGLLDSDARVRRAAAAAMVQLDPSGSISAVPVLVGELRATHDDAQIQGYIRDQVAGVLKLLAGPASAEAVTLLQPLLQDPDAGVRWRAKEVLTSLQGKLRSEDGDEARIKTSGLTLETSAPVPVPVESVSLTAFGDAMNSQTTVAQLKSAGEYAAFVLPLECGHCGYKSPVETHAGRFERQCYACGASNKSQRGTINVFVGSGAVQI